MLLPVNDIRAAVGIRPATSIDDVLHRAPLMLVATGKLFEYSQTDWGDAVQMIGPCVLDDPRPETVPEWLEAIERPIVLVATSSEKQADAELARTAIAALAGDPVHVVATPPATRQQGVTRASPNATVCRFIPHGVVLDRAVCAVTHGGMGATQRRSPVACRCAPCRTGAINSRSHAASRWPGAARDSRRRG
jgi:UDP:flavonoid glycosyltransferase YjiC (YdhE family)